MPSTINGIGTWYWGKKNYHRAMGTCEGCGAYVELSSFDTTLYFVVFFVPVIPLRRKRVIRQCPGCTRHGSMSMTEWEEAKRKAAEDAAAKLRDGADLPAAVQEAVGALVAFEDEEAFLTLARRVRDRIGGDAEALATLGAGYACFGRAAEAEAAYRASLAVEDDPRVRETLAGNLITQGRPDEAAPLLTHVIAEKRREQVGDLYVLAAGYQAKGMHREALALLDGVAAAFPGEESEADFRRLRKMSRRHEATGKPVRSPFVASARRGRPKGALSPKAWAALGSAAAVAALTIYLAVAWWAGRSRDVWLVNGIARAYDVSVSGEVHTIPPMSPLKIALAEGDIRVKVLDEKLGLPEETCRIRTPFLSRPFIDRTYVINPDRVAIVLKETAIYSAAPRSGSGSQRVLVGRVLHEFKDIDYEFEPFPGSLSTERSRLIKRRVTQLRDHSPAETIALLKATLKPAEFISYLEEERAIRTGVGRLPHGPRGHGGPRGVRRARQAAPRAEAAPGRLAQDVPVGHGAGPPRTRPRGGIPGAARGVSGGPRPSLPRRPRRARTRRGARALPAGRGGREAFALRPPLARLPGTRARPVRGGAGPLNQGP
ncbi:MAG: zinc ribbon domain-containing protein [Planctomycetota bacterium]|jgi:tetratricopeptide (TPR) repeat protein